MLINLGGWGAIQRLSQRRDILGTLDKLLRESEERIKIAHENTSKQARRNFYFAMIINMLLVVVGICLVVIAISQPIQRPDNIEAWIAPGSGGGLSVYFSEPIF